MKNFNYIYYIYFTTTDKTSISIRLNSSKHVQAPVKHKPFYIKYTYK